VTHREFHMSNPLPRDGPRDDIDELSRNVVVFQ